jgi:predicted Zn-dependent peptidase
MDKIDTRKLDCGVKVVMETIPYVQSAAIGVWVKNGAVDEAPQVAGISHFIEHMMFKGTEKRSAKAIAEDIDKIGGQMNAFTGKEATCYYVKTISSNLLEGAEVILDMINNAVFDSQEMTKERKVIFEEINMIEDQPDDLAHDTAIEEVFSGSPLGNSIIGTKTSLKGITRPVITEYKKKTYTRDSIVVSVAGNFDKEKLCQYLNDKFGNLEATKQERKLIVTDHTPKTKVITKDIQQSHICLATRGVKLDDSRCYAFSILNNIMGGSMSSRFFQNIREEKGLAYSVYSMSSYFKDAGYYNIYAGVSHEQIEAAINGIKEELEKLSKNGVTKEELAMSKEQLKSSYIFGQENVASRMFAIGKRMLLLNNVLDTQEYISGIDNVTLEDIENITPLICDIKNYTAVCVTDKKINLDAMMGY